MYQSSLPWCYTSLRTETHLRRQHLPLKVHSLGRKGLSESKKMEVICLWQETGKICLAGLQPGVKTSCLDTVA